MSNFLQLPIISDIVTYLPTNIEEMIRLPNVGWRYHEKKNLMGKQVNFVQNDILELLNNVDRDEE